MATIEARLQALENKHAEPLNMMIIILDGDEPTEDQQRQIDEGERIGQNTNKNTNTCEGVRNFV